MEFTKGEWRYCQANPKEGCPCGLIWGLDQDAVVAIAIEKDETGARPHKEMVANAHLIAAAVNACQKVNPDNPQAVAESISAMYEALKNMVERHEQGLALGEELDLRPAREALAQVERKE